jgi:hypothetical protein
MLTAASLEEGHIAFAYLNVTNPLVAWQVYRGTLVSSAAIHESALSFWMTRYLHAVRRGPDRAQRYRAELGVDELRRQEYPRAVSRLRGFFAFPDKPSAERAARKWQGPFQADFLAEICILNGARVSRYDAEWITHKLDSPDRSWVAAYFGGEAYGDTPIWELLVEGKALVFGTELRKIAYETVRRVWPDSLAMLELARLGVELGSDIGLITPFLQTGEKGPEVTYIMNFKDAKDEDFLRRVGEFKGPKNVADLNANSDLIPPDLRGQFFRI